jgi:CRP-like cAMP-binding protein
VLAVLGPDDFSGEKCLAAQEFRISSATAPVPTVVLVIENVEMIRVLHADAAFTHRFISYVLSRNIRSEENLTTSCSIRSNGDWLGPYTCWWVTVRAIGRRNRYTPCLTRG